jgi:hypothetical protein
MIPSPRAIYKVALLLPAHDASKNGVESPRGEEIAAGKGIGYNPGPGPADKPARR